MNFLAHIDILPHEALLDPQGKAVEMGLSKLNLPQITNVRVGKHIRLKVQAHNREKAFENVDKACSDLLANSIMEKYKFTLEEIPE